MLFFGSSIGHPVFLVVITDIGEQIIIGQPHRQPFHGRLADELDGKH